ncbi:hypothetical protein [Deinococcus radiophilus]|uniref:Uncharacterized protein n=1 Tax=Deinococcus radiophilus TaxID=32062 RepID=A0A431VQ95_9DEIO|nr:hypothetical protein [Deinococcus radiophilus]RTR25304.1 hypothetical protein EJ104_11405 [Deinococcus radiophilus]UFA52046.1 hypothetical protein LMT64_14065 [Deinococcus radiophilus]
MTAIKEATGPAAQETEVRYYLVGRVPVKLQERPDGVALVAYNPLLGGFVSDARYYSAIKRHEGDEDGIERIDEDRFTAQVAALGGQ